MLNLVQHQTESRNSGTLKQVQGDKQGFLRDHQVSNFTVDPMFGCDALNATPFGIYTIPQIV
jgi:hypothetical protein